MMMTADPLLLRGDQATGYRLTSVSRYFGLLHEGEDSWIALGDFLDDWYRAEPDQRALMIAEPIVIDESDPNRRWAALFAAVVDWLCWITEPYVDPPDWITDDLFTLPEPWFVSEGAALHDWQLVESPAPFRMRRIYTDPSIVARA
jgi:hypothetical protein